MMNDARTRRTGFQTLSCITIILILLTLYVLPVYAQDVASTAEVTADEVNNIARKMFCPVCENIPLDVCPTAACAQWRDEIRTQLEAGQTEQQIIDAFVARYGERVIGTPQDPALRALSLVTPWLVAIVVVIVAGMLFVRWRRNAVIAAPSQAAPASATMSDDEYRARLERDLQQRR